MPDITLCANKNCPLKDKCYRFTATPDPLWQSYADFEPVKGKCDHFWDNTNKKGKK